MPRLFLLAIGYDSVILVIMEEPVKDHIQFHINHERTAILQVNRPEARNALNWSAQQRFADLVKRVALDPTIRVLIITGSGNQAFVSGGDLKELIHHPERIAGERLNRVMSSALNEITVLPIPVIAAINGDALGGGAEIVTACDLRIATAAARFSFAHIRNGLTTGWGGTGRLIRLVGESRAMELLLTARLFAAEEARAMGLVHRVVADQVDVLQAALDWANDLIALPQDALAAMKALVHVAGDSTLAELSTFEAQQFVDLWETPDHKEALAAFQQKRAPRFNQD
jgi:enoyl-CoA hydratase